MEACTNKMPGIGLIDQSRLDHQTLIDARFSHQERNEMGQFATPPALANDIAKAVSQIWEGGQIQFLEPALGTGAFYSALLHNFPHDKIESAVGVEREQQYANVARELWGGMGLNVTTGDFMALGPGPDDKLPNLILTNPPYVRHHHLSGDEKLRFRGLASEVSRGTVSGLSGLYTYFVFAAHRWLAEDGLAAWLIPSEFMDVNYGESLRRYFSTEVTLLRMHRFDPADSQFANALVSSAVIIFRQERPSSSHSVQVSHGGMVSSPDVCTNVPVASLQTNSKWSRVFDGGCLRMHAPKNPLSALFTIKRGIATGANSFFIRPRRELAERGIDERFVKPILPPARSIKTEVIKADESGFPEIPDQLAVIDTDVPMDRVKEECLGLWEYLQAGLRNEVQNAYLLTKRSPWYRQEQRPPSPFLCTYMGRQKDDGKTFRFLWNRSNATAANTYLLMYPVGPLKAALAATPEIGGRVLELLNSLEPISFTEQGRVYGGGLFKIEPRELGRVDATAIVEDLGLTISAQPSLIWA